MALLGGNDEVDAAGQLVLAGKDPVTAGVQLGGVGQGLYFTIVITQVYFAGGVWFQVNPDGIGVLGISF